MRARHSRVPPCHLQGKKQFHKYEKGYVPSQVFQLTVFSCKFYLFQTVTCIYSTGTARAFEDLADESRVYHTECLRKRT